MKVLHFYKAYYPDSFGGIEQAIFQQASGSSKFGVDSSVLALSQKNEQRVIKFNEHHVYRCRSNFKIASTDFSLSALWRFNELAQEADIVHYHFPWPFMDLAHFVVNHKKPSLVTYHSDIIRQKKLLKLYKPLQTRFLKSVDAIVATSPNYQETSDVLRQHKNKVEIIPIGLNKSSYPPINTERMEYWRKILGNKFFIFIGVLRYYKGLHILLDALAMGDLPTVIIGGGPIEHELKAKAKLLGLKNITFLGQLSENDKITILNLSYAMVFPSHLRSEAYGISLLEGAMLGKPLISSEIGTGTTFINIGQNTGIVIPPSSPDHLYLAMTHLWNNPIIAKKMGINASNRFSKIFTADRMNKSYADLYLRILDKRP